MLLNFVSGVGEENLEEKMMILYNINENTPSNFCNVFSIPIFLYKWAIFCLILAISAAIPSAVKIESAAIARIIPCIGLGREPRHQHPEWSYQDR